jgi:hypothetical protein
MEIVSSSDKKLAGCLGYEKLPEFKYLRPGTIISTLVDEKITELAKKEGISEDDWRKKYHKLEGAQTSKASSKKRKRRL